MGASHTLHSLTLFCCSRLLRPRYGGKRSNRQCCCSVWRWYSALLDTKAITRPYP
jgi:hypothetical protein